MSDEVALQELLQRLDPCVVPDPLRECRRALVLADGVEVRALECEDGEEGEKLRGLAVAARSVVGKVRGEVRDGLLGVRVEERAVEEGGEAGRVARDINESLRRSAGVVAEEVARSGAVGGVVDGSSRRLRMVRDTQRGYGDVVKDGAGVLSGLRRTDIVANVVIVLSFIIFFAVAAYVARRRVAGSNIATFVVRPVLWVATAPARVLSWVGGAVFSRRMEVSTPRPPAADIQPPEHPKKGVVDEGLAEAAVTPDVAADLQDDVRSAPKDYNQSSKDDDAGVENVRHHQETAQESAQTVPEKDEQEEL